MKALILAGGKATRLLPITAEVPKCLLPIRGKTIMGWQIAALQTVGISELIVLTGMHADQIKAYLKDIHPDMNCTFVYNNRFEETRPAHALWLAREHFRADDLIYLNGDTLFEADSLSAVIRDPHPTTTAIQKVPWDEEQVNVLLDGDRVCEIGKHLEASRAQGEFVGITKINLEFGRALADTLEELVAEERDQMFAVDAIQATMAKRPVMLFACDVTSNKALEIDTIEDYERAQHLWVG